MSNIAVIGIGYVGLVAGACFAELGNSVRCVDMDADKVRLLTSGVVPIYEPGLDALVERSRSVGRLEFTTNYADAVATAEFVFITVDTPAGLDGQANFRNVRLAAERIAPLLKRNATVVNKSTMPVGAGDQVARIMRQANPMANFQVVSNPEFLREGQAVRDFLQPERVVIGADTPEAAERVAGLYASFSCPIIVTDLRTAEMVKYASNAFLAARISFINEIAAICDRVGADVQDVVLGMGLDSRIGVGYLEAGLGYGGSCLPKDVKALEQMALAHGFHPLLLKAVMEINADQRLRTVQLLKDLLGPLNGHTIGVLGLSFKPDTDDIRESPSIAIIHLLEEEGVAIKAYDPAAGDKAKQLHPGLEVCGEPYAVADGSDALLVAVQWEEFRALDMRHVLGLLRRPILIDGRNMFDPNEMRMLGFVYVGIGRGSRNSAINASAHESADSEQATSVNPLRTGAASAPLLRLT